MLGYDIKTESKEKTTTNPMHGLWLSPNKHLCAIQDNNIICVWPATWMCYSGRVLVRAMQEISVAKYYIYPEEIIERYYVPCTCTIRSSSIVCTWIDNYDNTQEAVFTKIDDL